MTTSFIGLDTQETTGIRALPSDYRQYKLRSSNGEMVATIATFESESSLRSGNQLSAIRTCSNFARFVRHKTTGEVRVHTSRCRQRWCPLCSQTLANWRTMALLHAIKKVDRPKFITLTLKHTSSPLEHQINHLYLHFQRLRKTKFFRKTVQGGVWFFQVKQSKSDGLWHPHLHIVADSKFLPKNELSVHWLAITGNSKIVDIKLIRNPKSTAKYVARYSARPANLIDLPSSLRVDLIRAMAGRRLCGTWGSLHKMKLVPPKMDQREQWVPVGIWHLVITSQSTSATARAIVRAWVTSKPLSEDCTLSDISKLNDHHVFSDEVESYSQDEANPRSPPCQQLTLPLSATIFDSPATALANRVKSLKMNT